VFEFPNFLLLNFGFYHTGTDRNQNLVELGTEKLSDFLTT